MLRKKILAKLHNFPADGMSISLESKHLYNIDPVIFQEVTKKKKIMGPNMVLITHMHFFYYLGGFNSAWLAAAMLNSSSSCLFGLLGSLGVTLAAIAAFRAPRYLETIVGKK